MKSSKIVPRLALVLALILLAQATPVALADDGGVYLPGFTVLGDTLLDLVILNPVFQNDNGGGGDHDPFPPPPPPPPPG